MEVLSFELNGELYGIPSEFVQEVVAKPDIIVLPEFTPWIQKVIKLRGEFYGVVSLEKVLNIEKIAEKEAIIFNRESISGCFLVSRVVEIIDADETSDRQPDDVIYNSTCRESGNQIKIIDIENVLNSNDLKKMWSVEEDNS